MCWVAKGTVLAHVVHQQNLLQILFGRCVEDAVHGAQERGPSFVMETDNNSRQRKRLAVLPPRTPVRLKTETHCQSGNSVTFEHSFKPKWSQLTGKLCGLSFSAMRFGHRAVHSPRMSRLRQPAMQ